MRGASPDGSHPGLHSKPVDAAIRRVLASHCHGGRHGLTILVENTQHKQTRNPTFTSHLTLTPVRLTSPLTHTQPHHHSHLMDVPPTPLALISPSAHYLSRFLSILILQMFYKLSRPMPTLIYRIMNARNLAAPTKPTHPPPP